MNIVVEDDRNLRILQVALDRDAPAARRAAIADYLAHDLALDDAVARLRAAAPALCPARVVMVSDQDGLRAALPVAQVLLMESLRVGAVELAAAPRLKVIQLLGSLPDRIDRAACEARGVTILTQRRLTNVAVAEHAMALLMALAKRLPFINGLVTPKRIAERHAPLRPFDKRHAPGANWARVGGLRSLHDMTLGVLGMGDIGVETARLARGCGMRVLYHRRHRVSPGTEQELGAAYRTLPELLAQSDALSIHLPLNDTTRGLLGAPELAAFRPGALLVNTSRAEIIDRRALIAALDDGRLAGVALDVMHDEPAGEDDPLLDRPNVLLTPHLAGGSRQVRFADFAAMLTAIARALDAP